MFKTMYLSSIVLTLLGFIKHVSLCLELVALPIYPASFSQSLLSATHKISMSVLQMPTRVMKMQFVPTLMVLQAAPVNKDSLEMD